MKADLSTLSHQQLSLLHALLKRETDDDNSVSGKQLLAYYNAAEQQSSHVSMADLRSVARELLPEHMVPDLFVPVAEIPRLANGKVDTNNLPTVVVKRSSSANDCRGAEHEFGVIAGVLGELLGFDDVRMEDNFFELGGDSITAIRLASRVREAGIPIDVKAITSDLTLGEIAADASRRLAGTGADSAAESSAESSASDEVSAFGKYPLTPIQKWFFSQQHPQPQHWNLAGAIEIPNPVNTDKLKRCLLDSVMAHPVIGSAFISSDSVYEGVVPDRPPPAELIQVVTGGVLNESDHERIIADLQAEFSLHDGWLLRFVLVNDGNSHNSTLLWVCHHLVMDALSVGVFFSDVQKRYQNGVAAASVGRCYRDWAIRLSQHAQQRAKSSRSTPMLSTAVTAQHGRQPADIREADCVSRLFVCAAISVRETQSNAGSMLKALVTCVARALGNTLQMDDLRIDIEHHGRDLFEDVDVTDSIGWFTTYFPCYLKAVASADVRDSLAAVSSALDRSQRENSFYLLDRYCNGVEDSTVQAPSVLLNFQGVQSTSVEGGWQSTFYHWNSLRSVSNVRSHDIELNAMITAQGLELNWRYPTDRFTDSFFDEVTKNLEADLKELVANLGNSSAHIVGSHSDLGLSQTELDDFLDSLE